MKIMQDPFAQVRRATTDHAPTPRPPSHRPSLSPGGRDIYHPGYPEPRQPYPRVEPWFPQLPVSPTPAFPFPGPELPGEDSEIDIKIGKLPKGRKITIIIGTDEKQNSPSLDLLA